jgi:hypothetical protein
MRFVYRYRAENRDVEMDLRAANLRNADLSEAQKGRVVAVRVADMPGEGVGVVKRV